MAWRKWQDWVTLIAGAWLVVSPWILSLTVSTTVQWTFVVLGAAIAVTALFALANPKAAGVEWLAIGFGALTFIAPWLLGFTGLATAKWDAMGCLASRCRRRCDGSLVIHYDPERPRQTSNRLNLKSFGHPALSQGGARMS